MVAHENLFEGIEAAANVVSHDWKGHIILEGLAQIGFLLVS